jgi:hypothetical protein
MMSAYIGHVDYILYSASKLGYLLKENNRNAIIVTVPTSSSLGVGEGKRREQGGEGEQGEEGEQGLGGELELLGSG